MTHLDVFAFDDYRLFLQEYYEEQKTRKPELFSYRFFSKKAGFKTANFLQLIIQGKRNLTLESLRKVALAIPLRGRKAKYFEALVLFNQAKTTEEKARHHDQLTSYKEYLKVRLVEDTQKAYFAKWYYPVVREMVKMKDFQPDPHWIAKQLRSPLKRRQAREAWEVLKHLGMVVEDEGKWSQKDNQLKTRDQESGSEIRTFHRNMIQLAFDSLDMPKEKRDISGITMSLTPAKTRAIRRRIRDFREEIQGIIQKPLEEGEKEVQVQDFNHINQVYQLNMQFFQLAGS